MPKRLLIPLALAAAVLAAAATAPAHHAARHACPSGARTLSAACHR